MRGGEAGETAARGDGGESIWAHEAVEEQETEMRLEGESRL